ncbi:protein CFAP20DC-like [Diadema antillarum]|uniref:protein CFAP20DC-like n=1 Tax=Diadema antillarum TaxID=105358 RepID=UPI003A83952B
MFKNEFQGGPFVEVFSSQGKEPLLKWKLAGQASIQKTFDKECKSYIHTLEGASTTTKMQLPKDSKQTLALIQRYLVIQFFVPLGQDFSMELGISDMSNNKRRLFLSTAQRETSATPLHAKVPLTIMKRAVWLNLAIDMVSLVGELFRGQTFKSLDTLLISASCKLRKIFTLKDQPPDTTDDDVLYNCDPPTNSVRDISSIPKTCQFSSDVLHLTQVLSMAKLRHVDFKMRGDGSRPSSSTEPDLNSSLRAKDDRPMHIAFGTKVPVPSTSSGRKVSASGQREGSSATGSRTSRSSHSGSHRTEDPLHSARGQAPPSAGEVNKLVVHGHHRQQSDPGTEIQHPDGIDKGTLAGSNTWTSSGIMEDRQPHPPRENSGGRSRRVVKVRPSSGKKSGEAGRSDADESSDADLASARGRHRSGGAAKDNNPHPGKSDSSDMLSAGLSNMMKSSNSAGRVRTRLDSLSESDEGGGSRQGRMASGRSKIPRRKKKERGAGGGGPKMSEKGATRGEEDPSSKSAVREDADVVAQRMSMVQSVEGRVVKNGADVSVRLGGSDSGVAISAETSEPEGNQSTVSSSRSSKAEPKDKGNLYTFMSPPHTVPIRAAENSRQLDPKKLQMKMQQIIDSKTPTNIGQADNGEDFEPTKGSSRDLISPETDFLRNAQLSDDSDLDDDRPGSGRLKVKQTIERSHSPKRAVENGGRDPVRSSSRGEGDRPLNQPALSMSPTLRRSKLAALAESQGGASQNLAPPRGSLSRMSIRSKHLKEIPKDDPRLSDDYDWRKYQSNNSSLASSLEANMLASLRRQQLEELYEERNEGAANNSFEIHNYGDDDESSSSGDTTTTFSTWRPPDNLHRGKGYQEEMNYEPAGNPLMQSNPRDWSNLFSPPIVLPSEKLQNEQNQLSPVNELGSGFLSDGSRHKSSSSESQARVGPGGETDGEEELDLLYDPCLNCYFDPKTGKYYELA